MYSYLVINKITRKFYYGVKYSSGCLESDLWNTYFTSSKLVRKDVELFGKDNFYFEIRKRFTNVDDCLNWEHRVLRRLRAKDREDCYNLTNGGAVFNASKRMLTNNPMQSEESIRKMVQSKKALKMRGQHKSTANTSKTLDITSKRMQQNNPMKSSESLQKMIETKKKNGTSCSGTTWLAHPVSKSRKRVLKHLVEEMLKAGWITLSNRIPIPEVKCSEHINPN